ncbi:MAG: PaaI family thioesterase [Actinobacteria bacterium]|nr:PaaI family thioesterase [Actinomycetota bacterium]
MSGRLPGLFGLELVSIGRGSAEARMDVRSEFLAPNDFLHAGAVITLADSCCGMGCIATLPDGVAGFTTAELKTNFLRSAKAGDALRCRATIAHEGRTTQVWDAVVVRESDGRDLALFRCTQFLLPDDDARTAGQRR